MTIGETIRKLRRARDITQEDLAELLHITPQAVSRWETDATMPDVTSLIGLARVFDCSTDDLLGLNNIKKDERIEY
ncbi:MAG: helix-turn-helix transcriptional regulator, partial [Clostridia bacterium]|nr:helix-turn-helix transcriptional regulator [Clostridia bacterium]